MDTISPQGLMMPGERKRRLDTPAHLRDQVAHLCPIQPQQRIENCDPWQKRRKGNKASAIHDANAHVQSGDCVTAPVCSKDRARPVARGSDPCGAEPPLGQATSRRENYRELGWRPIVTAYRARRDGRRTAR